MMGKKISDLITLEEIEQWRPEVPVIISAPTGSGKSYFIMNKLCQYAKQHNKKILLMTSRLICVDQFCEMNQENSTLEIINYQKMETYLTDANLDDYDYLVSDEFHYFIADSSFNNKTDISFNKIAESKAIKIYMSATSKDMTSYIKGDAKLYVIPPDYSWIQNLIFFDKKSAADEFIAEVRKHKCKGILFINNIEDAVAIYKKYRDIALFNCSKSQKEYEKYVDQNGIQEIITQQKFSKQILITTTAMDIGVNIKDLEVKYEYVDLKDYDEIIQCIGRKRIQNQEDKVTIWMRNLNGYILSGLKGNCCHIISRALDLIKYGENGYLKRYAKDPDPYGIVYLEQDKTITINQLMLYKKRMDISRYEMWLSYPGGFRKYIATELQQKYFVIYDDKRIEYLDNHKDDILLSTPDRKELIETMDFKRQDGKLINKRETINTKLNNIGIPYYINELDTRISGKRYKHAWQIKSLKN